MQSVFPAVDPEFQLTRANLDQIRTSAKVGLAGMDREIPVQPVILIRFSVHVVFLLLIVVTEYCKQKSGSSQEFIEKLKKYVKCMYLLHRIFFMINGYFSGKREKIRREYTEKAAERSKNIKRRL